jgi:hypothetical protein
LNMPKDHIAEVDAILSDALPDDIDEVSQETVADQREQEMIELLKHAKEELGKSPSMRDFESLGFETSAEVIEKTFGTWNNASAQRDRNLRVGGGRSSTNSNQ